MARTLLALLVGTLAAWHSNLLHPSRFFSLFLPLLALAAFLYAVLRTLARVGRSGGDSGGAGDGGGEVDCGWSSDSGDCGGGDGGGGD